MANKKRRREPSQQIAKGDVPSSSPLSNDKHQTFMGYAQTRHVRINSVKPTILPGRGVGLVTTAPIEKGQQILFIPEKAMFKPNEPLLRKEGLLFSLSPHAQLALSLMAELLKESSAANVWQATWPSISDLSAGMPLFWEADLQAFLPPAVQHPLERQRVDFEKDQKSTSQFRNRMQWADAEFTYYWSIVNSRSFHFKPPGAKPGFMVLCPFIDYMNHGPTGAGCIVQQSPKGYEVIADRDYAAGEEILATYGALSNDKLFVHYGFVPSSDDCFLIDDDIRLDHVIISELSPHVRDQLQDVGFLGAYALLPTTNELCFKTQVAVRAMLLTANEWEYFMTNGDDLGADQSHKVKDWLVPHLKKYRAEAVEKLQQLENFRGGEEREIPVSMLRTRWKQIQEAIDRFLAQDEA